MAWEILQRRARRDGGVDLRVRFGVRGQHWVHVTASQNTPERVGVMLDAIDATPPLPRSPVA